MKSIAVIGSGITGLASAFLLKQKKCPVEIYEAADRVGGVIRSVRKEGYLAEFGPNTLLNTSKKIEHLIQMANLSGHVTFAEDVGQTRYLVRGGRVIAMPSTAFGFLTSPLFSWFAKFNLFMEPFRPRWKNKYEETVAHFVRRRFGNEFLTYAIDALVAGIFAGNPERLSVRHGFPKLYMSEQKYGSLIRAQFFGARDRKKRGETSKQEAKVFSFDDGLQVLTDAMAASLDNMLHLNNPVQKITRTPTGWKVGYLDGNIMMEREHSAVLLCTSAYTAQYIALDTPEKLSLAPLGQISYAPVASVALGYRRSAVGHPLTGFGMLVPGVERLNILGTLFSSSLFKNRAPEGRVILSSYIGGMRQPELAGLPEDKLYELVHHDLAGLLNITEQPTFKIAHYFPRAIPQYDVGYGFYKDHIAKIQERCPGLFIGGNYTRGPALSDNLLSGFDFADRIEKHVKETGLMDG